MTDLPKVQKVISSGYQGPYPHLKARRTLDDLADRVDRLEARIRVLERERR